MRSDPKAPSSQFKEAKEARAYQPEMILMDINLPGISGLNAMKILRADPATAHIPIVALGANAVPRDIEQALDAGCFSYPTKPIMVTRFMEALGQGGLILCQIRKTNPP